MSELTVKNIVIVSTACLAGAAAMNLYLNNKLYKQIRGIYNEIEDPYNNPYRNILSWSRSLIFQTNKK